MSDYNFSALTDLDFERLANDIIAKKENIHIEEFKTGKDAGIDGRLIDLNGRKLVVQAKHYWKSGFSALLKHCQKIESAKVKKLKPDRYIFVCSSELSPQNKDSILEVFEGVIKTPSDIFGLTEIDSFLRDPKNQNIVQKNYKLWLTSVPVLNIIQHSGTYSRSKFKLNEILSECSLYVHTKNHADALKKLQKSNCLVITGEPGVGKSTLAEQMCNYLAATDYQFIEVKKLSDAWDLISEDSKQVFYFDDFLGANYLDSIEHNEDSDVMNFINLVKKNNNKKFILTSRSSILTQGKIKSITFKTKNIESEEFLLNIDNLTKLEKAEILYNHIVYSKMDKNLSLQFFYDKKYRDVIEHKNFNPRLIKFITDFEQVKTLSETEYCSFIKSSLDNPEEIWKQAVTNQLKVPHRIIIYLVAINQSVKEDELEKYFERYFHRNFYENSTETAFSDAITLLTGSYLKRTIGNKAATFELINPSLGDYINPKLYKEPSLVSELLFIMWPDIHILTIKRFMFGNKNLLRKEQICERLLNKILEVGNYLKYHKLSNYLIPLLSSKSKQTDLRQYALINFIENLNDDGICSGDSLRVLYTLISSENILQKKLDWNEILLNSTMHASEHDDLKVLSDIINTFDNQDDDIGYPIELFEIKEAFETAVLEYWTHAFNNEIEYEITFEQDCNEEFNEDSIEEQIQEQLEASANYILMDYSFSISVSSNDLVGFIDIDTYLEQARSEYADLVADIPYENDDKDEIQDEDEWDEVDSIFNEDKLKY